MRFCLICILFCVGFISANAQKFDLADKLFKQNKYREAAVEYERVAYLSTDNETEAKALLNKAFCYKNLFDYPKATEILDRVNFIGLSDSLQVDIRYELSLNAYLSGNFSKAESQIKQAHFFVKDTVLLHKFQVLNILVLNELEKWTEAKEAFHKYLETNYSTSFADSLVNEIYIEKHIPKKKSVKKARVLSSVFPGTGQAYAGYPHLGATNLLLQLGSLGFTGLSAYYGYYVTAFVVGYGMFGKFYTGGLTNTEYLVKKKNYQKKRSFNDEVKKILLTKKADI